MVTVHLQTVQEAARARGLHLQGRSPVWSGGSALLHPRIRGYVTSMGIMVTRLSGSSLRTHMEMTSAMTSLPAPLGW